MIRIFCQFSLIAILLGVSQSANAASSEWVASGPNRVRLVVSDPASGDTSMRGVLDIDLAPGWKTYWKDPGDAGVPLEFKIDGSDNVSGAKVEFPKPGRYDDGTTVWAGYDEPVQLPIRFDRPDPAKPGVLKAQVFLGVCDKICVPVQADFEVPFGVAPSPVSDVFLVDQAFARLPAPAASGNGLSAAMLKDDMLVLEAELSADTPQELFLAAPAGWQFAAPVRSAGTGRLVSFAAKVLLKPDQPGTHAPSIVYTLAGAMHSVSGQVAISPF
jgi:DsbC/DsbD-like thiol-disulfide interchange protein